MDTGKRLLVGTLGVMVVLVVPQLGGAPAVQAAGCRAFGQDNVAVFAQANVPQGRNIVRHVAPANDEVVVEQTASCG